MIVLGFPVWGKTPPQYLIENSYANMKEHFSYNPYLKTLKCSKKENLFPARVNTKSTICERAALLHYIM